MASAPKEQVVKIRAELDNAVVVRPGDTLVLGIGVARNITYDEAQVIRERAESLLPGIRVVVVPADSMAVVRDEPAGIRKASYPLGDDEVQALRDQLEQALDGLPKPRVNKKGCTIHLNDDCLC